MTHAAFLSSVLSSFLASFVECIEALTIILAVGAVRGFRGALAGAGVALLALLLLVALAGRGLTHLPLAPLRIVVGALALPFGLRWLHKAVRRAAGIIPLRDEDAAFARELSRQRGVPSPARAWDAEAFHTCLRVTAMEGIEVVFIVLAASAAGPALQRPASAGALLALCAVILLGVFLHRPVSAIPENTLKFGVGVMLSAFGAFWLGEGSGLRWPGGDLALPCLTILVLLGSLAAVSVMRARAAG